MDLVPTDKEYEATFDPMHDLRDRWGISLVEAEEFLENAGYFDGEFFKEVEQ